MVHVVHTHNWTTEGTQIGSGFVESSEHKIILIGIIGCRLVGIIFYNFF